MEEHLGLTALAIQASGRERTSVVTEGLPLSIHVAEDVVEAEASDDLFLGIAGDPFGSSIPVADPPVHVHEVDPVIQGVYQLAIEGVRWNRTARG
jgi:hypothetical protein